jgi:hypothetical protein
MGSVAMIVHDVLRQKPPEMALIQSDYVVKQLTSATADPAFRNSVLPGALDGGLDASNTHGLNCRGNFQTVFRIVITDEEWRSSFIGKRFPQLLHNPGARRMARDVEVQDAPAVVANNEEAIEETEGDRRNGKEIHGRDGFAMIAEKCRPPPSRFWVPGSPLHPAGDASLRNMEASIRSSP